MKQNSLTPDELENLSKLLISNNKENILIGLQILTQYSEAVKTMHKELVLLKQLGYGKDVQKKALKLLTKQYPVEQLNEWDDAFWIFENYFDLFDVEHFDSAWHYFEKHETLRLDYMHLIRQNERYVRQYFPIADVLARYYKKQLIRAEQYYLLVLDYDPKDPHLLKTLGNLYQNDFHDYPKAMQYFDKALDLDIHDDEAWESKGILLLDGFKNMDAAIDIFETTIQRFPKNEQLNTWLADAYMNKNTPESFQKGKDLIQEILKRRPRNIFAWTIYGNHLWLTERNIKAAEEAYLEGLKIDEDNPNLLANLAELYDVEHQDYEAAQDLYVKAFAADMDDVFHLCNFISLLVLKNNNLADARDYYLHLKTLVFEQVQRVPELNDLQWENFQKAEGVLWEVFSELRG